MNYKEIETDRKAKQQHDENLKKTAKDRLLSYADYNRKHKKEKANG